MSTADIIRKLTTFTPQELEKLRRMDPRLYCEVEKHINQAFQDQEREEYEGSLISFFQRSWREIDPANLSINWHHIAVAEELEDITWGRNRNLIVNIPPRHTKTILVNVCWPAWIWAQSEIAPLSGPQVKFLCVSYGATLSEEIALKMKRLVVGEWYQSLWGDRVKLQDDQQNRANFENTAGGARISNSIEGGILGRGGDIKIIDDPQTRKGADSEAERRKSLAGMSDLTTRVTDPRYAAQVLIMQRLHLQDATDWALNNWPKNTRHLMFPARFEEDRACYADKRTQNGELLWPEVWSEEELAQIEGGLAALDGEMLSDYAIQGQLQQNPIARSGGIITSDDWQVWPEYEPQPEQLRERPDGSVYIPLPQVSHVILSLDTAVEEKTSADYNACVVLGVWSRPRKLIQIVGAEDPLDDGEQPRVIIMGAWRARCKLNDETIGRNGKPVGLVQRVADTARMFGVDRIIIEAKTRGRDVTNELHRQYADENFQIQMFEPGKHGDKVARIHAVQPLFAQGLVYCPGLATLHNDHQGRQAVRISEFQWAKNVIQEVSQIPNGTHDDYADAVSQGLLTLRDEGFLQLTKEYIRQQTAARMASVRHGTSVVRAYGVG